MDFLGSQGNAYQAIPLILRSTNLRHPYHHYDQLYIRTTWLRLCMATTSNNDANIDISSTIIAQHYNEMQLLSMKTNTWLNADTKHYCQQHVNNYNSSMEANYSN